MENTLVTLNQDLSKLPNISITSGTNGDSQFYINNIIISQELIELLLTGKTIEIEAGRRNTIKIKLS